MKIRKLLAAITDPSILSEDELKILFKKASILVQVGYTKIIEKLLSRKPAPVIYSQFILVAIKNGHYDMVELLFRNGYRLNNLTYEERGNFYETIISGLNNGDIKLIDLMSKYCAELFDIYKLINILLLSLNRSSIKIPHEKSTLYLDYILTRMPDLNKIDFVYDGKFIGYEASELIIKYGKRVSASDVKVAFKQSSIVGLVYLLKFRSDFKDGYIYFGDDKVSLIELFSLKDEKFFDDDSEKQQRMLYLILITELNIDVKYIELLYDRNEHLAETSDTVHGKYITLSFFDKSKRPFAKNIDECKSFQERREEEHRVLQGYIDKRDANGLTELPRNTIAPFILLRIKYRNAIVSSEATIFLLNVFGGEYFNYLCEENRVDVLKQLPKDNIIALTSANQFVSSERELSKYSIDHLAETALRNGQIELLQILINLFPSQLSEIANEFNSIKTDATYKSIDVADACFMHKQGWDNTISNRKHMGPDQFSQFKNVYSELLPLIKLASILENNLNEDHIHAMTERLAFLFRSEGIALDYLEKCESLNPTAKQPVHDACTFSFPKIGLWSVALWSGIVSRLGFQATKFLPWAVVLENQYAINGKPLSEIYHEIYAQEQLQHFDRLKAQYTAELDQQIENKTDIEFFKQSNKEKLEQSVLRKVQNELTRMAMQKLRKFIEESLQTNAQFQSAAKADRTKMIDNLIKYRDIANLELDELTTIIAKHGYARAAENPEFARQCILCSMTEFDFNRCLDMIAKPKKGDKIPNIVIDGSTIAFPNYYLRKLRPDEPLGFILGEKTACCQSVGSQGEKCAIHGMTSENSGFLVIFEKETNKVIGQTWVCVSKKNRLIFDSLEYIPRFDEKMILTFFKAAARKALEFGFKTVVVGLGGNTPLIDESERHYMAESEQPVDYADYHDSQHGQVILATTENIEELTKIDFSKVNLFEAYHKLVLALRKNDLKLARLLLDGGIREPANIHPIPGDTDNVYYNANPLLLTCVFEENLKLFKILLLEYHVNPNIYGHKDSTALVAAAAIGQREMCELLCDCPETIIVRDNPPKTHFHDDTKRLSVSELAAAHGHTELAQYLKGKEQEYLERIAKSKQQTMASQNSGQLKRESIDNNLEKQDEEPVSPRYAAIN